MKSGWGRRIRPNRQDDGNLGGQAMIMADWRARMTMGRRRVRIGGGESWHNTRSDMDWEGNELEMRMAGSLQRVSARK